MHESWEPSPRSQPPSYLEKCAVRAFVLCLLCTPVGVGIGVVAVVVCEHCVAVGVSCDGGGGALGHPKIYLEISKDGKVVCPYCSRTFKLAEGVSQAVGY